MFLKMQNGKSVVGYGTHYTGAALLLKATTMLVQPWMLPIAIGLTVSQKIADEIKTKKVTEEYFKPHQKNHPFSPNLQKMVDQLYKNSNLDHHKAEIFDYDDMKTVNAGFVRKMGKPVILVSTPLLEAFQDDEEFAVLAHEFAHASARHHRSVLPFDVINGVTKTSANLAIISQAISTGGAEIAISAASALLIGAGVKKHLSAPKKAGLAAAATTAFGMMAYFNPAILAAIVVRQTVGITSTLIEKSFSRTREYQADRGAVLLGANPLSLIKALRKMEQIQANNLKKAPKIIQKVLSNPFTQAISRCFATHPPTEKRIARLKDIAKKNGYSKLDIHLAIKGDLEPLHVNKDIPQGRVFDMASRFLGSKEPIMTEYNQVSQRFKQSLEKITFATPQPQNMKIS